MNKRKVIITLAMTLLLVSLLPLTVYAGTPYLNYNYNYWGQGVPAPAAYIPVMSVGGKNIDPSLGDFISPMDLKVGPDGNIYVLDTGNNRIVVFDRGINLVKVVEGFTLNGVGHTFQNPQGIFIAGNLDLYIADTDNKRVVVLNQQGEAVSIIENPRGIGLPDDFDFFPMKVLVGRGDVLYVIARHVFEGIMVFDTQGSFSGYFGTISVVTNPLDLIWRYLSTERQREQQRLFIPTEFLNMDIDQYGFIYTVNSDELEDNLVKRLNPRGEDVLLNIHEGVLIDGDQNYRNFGPFSGPSLFVDVKAKTHGMYMALDTTRGRVYSYDSEGNLLYVFSGTGNIAGMMGRPVALGVLEGNVLVLDAFRGEIVFFEPTPYGALINEVVALLYVNDEASAVDKWRELIRMDENYPLAFAGIGRALLIEGEYREAMDYLRRGMDMHNYSLAFVRYRNQVLRETLAYVFAGSMILLALYFARRVFRLIKKGGKPGKKGGEPV